MFIEQFVGSNQIPVEGRDRSIRGMGKVLAATFALAISVCFPQTALAVASPTFSPTSGLFFPGPSVTLSAVSGSTVYYTLDGTQPTINSHVYSSAIPISNSTTINAIAVLSGVSSSIASADYKVDPTIQSVIAANSNYPIALWLRSDTGVTLDGSGNISTWSDVSGNSSDATQSSSSHRPLFVPDDWNGLPSASFDSSNGKFLNLPSGFANLDNPILYVVLKPTGSSNGFLLDLGNGAASDNFTASNNGTGVEFTITQGSTPASISSSTALTLDRYQLLEIQKEFYSQILTNGIQQVSGLIASSNNISRTNNHLGTDYSSTGNFFDGGIQEVLLYAGGSGANSNRVNPYMMSRYQLISDDPLAPQISTAGGSLDGPTQVAIAVPANCICRYTTDGTTPSNGSPIYSGPIDILFTQTLKAISIRDGLASAVSTASYTLDSIKWPAPDPLDTTPLIIDVESPSNN